MNQVDATRELGGFERLVTQHYTAVAAVAFAATRDLALSEDIAQDTFIAAWTGRQGLRDLSRVRPWLCAIARNRSKRVLHRRRREVRFDDDAFDAVEASPSALDAALDREAERALKRSLVAIPIRYREPLVLFYWEEQSIAQVASALEITEPEIGRAHV